MQLRIYSNFLSRTPTIQGPFELSDLMRACVAVDNVLLNSAALGDEEAKISHESMPQIWATIFGTYSNSSKKTNFSYSTVSLNREAKLAVLVAQRLLKNEPALYPEERRVKVKQLIDELPKLLVEVNLPESLKSYLYTLAREVQTALDQYEITGDFKLDDAFNRLQGAFNIAIVATADKESAVKMKAFIVTRLVPSLTVVSLALGIHNAAIDAYQFYAPAIEASQTSESI